MQTNAKKFVTIEEANEQFAQLNDEYREIQEISDKITALMGSLIEKRNERNLTQRDLAKVLKWKQPALARFERLESIPRLDTFLQVAHKLGCNLYIESFSEEMIPVQCIKSAKYVNYIDSDSYIYNNDTYSFTSKRIKECSHER